MTSQYTMETSQKIYHPLIHRLEAFSHLIGNTPIMALNNDCEGILAKLEYFSFSGSTKDRSTLSIIKNAIELDLLKEGGTIIESTSGNFGISLAQFSIALGLNFIPIIDPNITKINRKILKFLCKEVIEVTERDPTGGFLISRLKTLETYKLEHPDVFHPNQYGNVYNQYGYKSLVKEIASQVDSLDYIVVAVSTGGTIVGVANEIKKYFPDIKVVAVDVKGSMVFQNKPQRRNLTGLGSSRRSDFISKCKNIDEVLIFDEKEIVEHCRKLAREQAVFAGASSGATFAGARTILKRHKNKDKKIMIICHDKGTSYLEDFS